MNPMEKSPETSSETLNKPDEEQKNNIEINSTDDDIKCNDDSKEIDPYVKDIISKMYKKLSLKTHPDKQNGNNEIFIKVLNAYKSNDILMLLKISKQINNSDILNDILNNITSNDNDNSKIYDFIELEIEKMENKINELKHHVCWLWCNADNETKKKFKLP